LTTDPFLLARPHLPDTLHQARGAATASRHGVVSEWHVLPLAIQMGAIQYGTTRPQVSPWAFGLTTSWVRA
jgi:hypothetical protein